MTRDDVVAAALAAYPQLALLLRLDAVGWQWMRPPVDEQGHPVEVHGVRAWPGEAQVDALRIRAATDARAVRVDPYGALLWEAEGGLADVVEQLLHLPPPGSPYAPRLVIGAAPDELWRP
ncbi:hypothetical protein [Saccharothrix sp. HUAS TT1]|uniref:hypothetical protein n=1 Tax=unclassified Saccharothrix TaxID=2593673 RepID=UPI00345BB55A